MNIVILDFLSCLCGSEHPSPEQIAALGFLSCLCGSELAAGWRRDDANFLSCLCGSERDRQQELAVHNFLSCLCGSERLAVGHRHRRRFLSCLCGSELDHEESKSLIFKDHFRLACKIQFFTALRNPLILLKLNPPCKERVEPDQNQGTVAPC